VADTQKPAAGAAPVDPAALLRSRGYLALLVFSALLGVPVALLAYGFLALSDKLQPLLYTDLPSGLGFDGTPPWWPLPLLAVGGLLVALTIRYLPGRGGHEPTVGFASSGTPGLADLPGVVCAALATLAFGAVLGPEAPLMAVGSGVAAGAVRLLEPGLPNRTYAVVAATGSFAAVSSLLGSPLLGAFLVMEAAGFGGPMLGPVLVPGLLASGVGALVFTGMNSWTGLGTYSLVLHNVPAASTPTAAEFGWSLLIGVAAAVLGTGARLLALWVKGRVDRRREVGTVVLGLVVAGLAIAYAQGSGKQATEVLYSGQSAMDPLLAGRAGYSVAALALLVACKSLAYSASLGGFRGGPIFPSMFIGAAGGIALSHLPGLSLTAAFAMGIGAMSAAMLKLPLTAVLLATLLLGKQGVTVMPLVIVAVVVSYVLSYIAAAALGPGDRPH
jgi:H+/Cl- antiporter ClcA